ncbi:hypothetical protein D3C72_1611460 [compost metagenome]
MGNSHQHVALHRRPHHTIELQLQTTLLVLGQRDGHPHPARNFRAITQEKEQQVHHDAETDQKLECALAKAERLAGQYLATLGCPLGDLVTQTVKVTHAHVVQPTLDECREHVLAALDITGNVQLPAFDALVQRGALLHQQGADDDHRQDRHKQAHQRGHGRGKVTPPPAADQQVTLQRGEQDAEDHRPEDCAVVRQKNPEEGNGHQRQEYCQGLVL